MFALTGIANKGEPKKTVSLDDFIKEDVIPSVLDFARPCLELLDITL